MTTELLYIILLGVISGIVIDYLADVLPHKRKISPPFCLSCQAPILWKDLVFFRNCPECKTKRSGRSYIIRTFILVALIILWIFPPARTGFWIGSIYIIIFSLIMVIDIEHRLIIQPVLIPATVVSFTMGWVLHGFQKTLFGGLTGYIIMLVLYFLGVLFERLLARIRKIKLDEVALGFGDVNLSCALGFLLGFPANIAGLVMAIFLGGAASLLIIVFSIIFRRYKPFLAIPYAPFLILGAAILLFRP